MECILFLKTLLNTAYVSLQNDLLRLEPLVKLKSHKVIKRKKIKEKRNKNSKYYFNE